VDDLPALGKFMKDQGEQAVRSLAVRHGEFPGAAHEIILETAAARVTERGGRSDDKRSETAMEDRKKAGYF